MQLLYQEIPAVNEGRARAGLRVLVLQTLSHDHAEDRKRRSPAEVRAVVLRTLSYDHVEVRKRSAFANLHRSRDDDRGTSEQDQSSKLQQARGMFSPVAIIQSSILAGTKTELKERGPLKACITWAFQPIDIRWLNYILETAGAEDLLVPEWKFKDQPLGCCLDFSSKRPPVSPLGEKNLFEDRLGQNAEYLAVFLRQNRNFLGEDDTDLFVADAHAMNTIEGSTSGDNKGLGEPTTPATKITKGKSAAKSTGATKAGAVKTNNPNADYNPSKSIDK
ncbi:hypothetical protein TARUN_8296 [Trichoderma arundinaceum]|uniref:Uncharacterized protein n=1 Tax=Trichoderma arundinaceum TaxID=490622 RepID=A0A395NCW1_TRIAR|nr:hypothetical protein TARUN_8296 [Trichoderma arundinaceum]